MYELIQKDIIIEMKLSLNELINKDETINKKLKKIVGKNYKNNNGYLKKN